MDKPVEINPQGLRSAATEFDGAAADAKKLLETLKSAAESKGEPWGDDKSGKKFADGEKGYKKNRDNTFESLSGLVGVLTQNANNLRDTAATFEKNEQEAGKSRRNAVERNNNAPLQPFEHVQAPLQPTQTLRRETLRAATPLSKPAYTDPIPGQDPESIPAHPGYFPRAQIPAEKVQQPFLGVAPLTNEQGVEPLQPRQPVGPYRLADARTLEEQVPAQEVQQPFLGVAPLTNEQGVEPLQLRQPVGPYRLADARTLEEQATDLEY
ncbi:WXG100 family type VII secretion target [Nocardia sp. NPDC051570]|uniref:WXG100 family type VII secretion target n=1 Tax=Nocardia sp. NPDC051570 TaxID=3364324 RepID=UPI0037989F26